jgi:hypothetical protein
MSTMLLVLSLEVVGRLLDFRVCHCRSEGLLLSCQFRSDDCHSYLGAHFARILRLLFRTWDCYKYQRYQEYHNHFPFSLFLSRRSSPVAERCHAHGLKSFYARDVCKGDLCYASHICFTSPSGADAQFRPYTAVSVAVMEEL